MIRWLSRNGRQAALLLAALLLAATFANPRLALERPVHRYWFVLDITQSMNARDYHDPSLPPERLEYAKAAVARVLDELPCGSEAGLGLFTTQNVQFLFEPLEICAHHAVIADALAHVDWRMAWSADSFVEPGLYAALREIAKRDAGIRLVFFTDGQEMPPPSPRPVFNGKLGEVAGVIVGTGGVLPSVVPRYDRENHFLGNWQNADIVPLPVATATYQEPQAPPKELPREGDFLSWLDEPHLKDLAAITGLRYHRLEGIAPLSKLLRGADLAERRPAVTDLRPGLGYVALALVLAGLAPWASLRRFR